MNPTEKSSLSIVEKHMTLKNSNFFQPASELNLKKRKLSFIKSIGPVLPPNP